MPIRDHRSAHEAAEAMPLVTESAEVTAVEPLDRSRNDAVERAAVDRLAARDVDDYHRIAADGDPRVRWDRLREALDGGELADSEALARLAARHERPYPSLLRVELGVDGGFDFVPGQYVTVRFRGTPRPYSIANGPSADTTELCIRRVPGGRLTSDLFATLEPGMEVTVRGPQGKFVPAEPSSRDLAFLATGTGVAPLRSMIEYTFETGRDRHEGEPRDVWLFLGASWADDLPYRERFRELAAEHGHFHFVPTCTREPLLSDWDGETDYVQRVLVSYLADDVEAADLPAALVAARQGALASDVAARIDPENLEVYACGINAMVNTLVDAVTALGVPDRHVDAEGYG